MNFEKTQEQLDTLRNLTWQNGKLIESLSQLSVNGLETELQQGKSNIVGAIKSKGVDASIDDSMTQLADKITKIKEVEVKTLPAETSNVKANDLFNMVMKSQSWDSIYETVYENYVTNGGYVGVLMTALERGTRTSIALTGADAYYILEEDKFYTTDENKNLVTIFNGVETNLGTKNHLWDVNNAQYWRHVFYLYVEGSIADGNRENIHTSAFDYCRDSNIPNIQYKSNSGNVMHFHVSNPDTCNLKWNGGTTSNQRCLYFYTNVENANAQWAFHNNQNTLTYVNFEALKKLTNGTLIQASRVKNLDFPNLTEVTNGTLIKECNALEILSLSTLEQITYNNQNSVFISLNLTNCNILFPALKTFIDNAGIYHFSTLVYGSCKSIDLPLLEHVPCITENNQSILSLECPSLKSIDTCIANNCQKLKFISAPLLKTQVNYSNKSALIRDLPELEECLLPELNETNVYGGAPYGFINLPNLKHLQINCGIQDGYFFLYDGTAQNLIWLEFTTLTRSFNCKYWNPVNAVLSDSKSLVDDSESYSSNLDKFRDKFLNHGIVDRMEDRTGKSAFTFTVKKFVADALTDEIKQIITNKNWNLASV